HIRSGSQPASHFRLVDSIQLDPFLPGRGASHEPYRAPRQPERLAQKPDHRLVGPAILRRGCHANQERPVRPNARDLIRTALRRDPELEPHVAPVAVPGPAAPGRGPKSAVPRRTIVAPSSMAISKSS